MLANLGRNSSTLVVVLVALFCASLSSVYAGPIPSLAPRAGKRFQCADETHFFTTDDSDNVTQCPQGTICRATTNGSPCVFAESDSEPAPQTPAVPGGSPTATNAVTGDKPVETAIASTPPTGTDDDTCEADDDLSPPSGTMSEGGVTATPPAGDSQTSIPASATETVASFDSVQSPAVTVTGGVSTATNTAPPQDSVSSSTGLDIPAPKTDMPTQSASPPAEQQIATGSQASPQVPEPTGQLTDTSARKGTPGGQLDASQSNVDKTVSSEQTPKTDVPLPVDTAAPSSDTIVPDNTATPAPPAPTGSIGLSADSPPFPNLQVKQGEETVAGATASNGGDNKDTHVNGDFTYLHDVDDKALGACGPRVVDSLNSEPYYVAIAKQYFTTANANLDPVCKKKIRASYQGKSVMLQVVDRCEGCKANDLDMAPKAALQLFGDLKLGRVSQGTSWEWV